MSKARADLVNKILELLPHVQEGIPSAGTHSAFEEAYGLYKQGMIRALQQRGIVERAGGDEVRLTPKFKAEIRAQEQTAGEDAYQRVLEDWLRSYPPPGVTYTRPVPGETAIMAYYTKTLMPK